MRNYFYLTLVMILVAMILHPTGGHSQAFPTVKLSGAVGTSKSSTLPRSKAVLTDVFFNNSQIGWAVGSDGLILSSQDGGHTWKQRHLGSDLFLMIALQDEKRIRILSQLDKIFTTTNGGQSWTSSPSPVRGGKALRFVTPAIGWVVGRAGSIAKTINGGRTWQEQASGVYVDLLDIACFMPDNCIVGAADQTILTTTDGGKIWSRVRTPMRTRDIGRMGVTPNGTAWALSWDYKLVTLLRSDDRGLTWSVINDNLPGLPPSFFFWDNKNGIIVTNEIYRTEDGGVSWSRTQIPSHPFLQAVYFVNEKLGWAVGDMRTIFHTTDGGKTWEVQYQQR